MFARNWFSNREIENKVEICSCQMLCVTVELSLYDRCGGGMPSWAVTGSD